MSSFPTPRNSPPTPQQVAGVLKSVLLATQTLLGDPNNGLELRNTFIQFFTQPAIQLVMGFPSQTSHAPPPPNKQLNAELSEIKSSINALSKTVAGLQRSPGNSSPPAQLTTQKGKPQTQGKVPPATKPPTYATRTASMPRPSLVLELGLTTRTEQFSSEIVAFLNDRLSASGNQDVRISAARWTGKGNLVLTGHHTITQAQLTATSSTIVSLIREIYSSTHKNELNPFQARANVKWSKLLIHSVPTGVSDSRGAYTPEECHTALRAHNPSYSTLNITQKPSWVKSPSSYKPGSRSSLVVAFEDPDRTLRRSILSGKQLYILGVRAEVSAWKEKPNTHNTFTPSRSHSPATEAQHTEQEADMEEDPSPLNPTLLALEPLFLAKRKTPTTLPNTSRQLDGSWLSSPLPEGYDGSWLSNPLPEGYDGSWLTKGSKKPRT